MTYSMMQNDFRCRLYLSDVDATGPGSAKRREAIRAKSMQLENSSEITI